MSEDVPDASLGIVGDAHHEVRRFGHVALQAQGLNRARASNAMAIEPNKMTLTENTRSGIDIQASCREWVFSRQ